MYFRKTKNLSYIFSFVIHLIITILFYFVNFTLEPDETDFVMVGFGTYGNASNPGNAKDANVKTIKDRSKKKKVEVPKTKNSDANNTSLVEKKKEKETKQLKKKEVVTEKIDSGEGNYGFEIDFGGKGKRRIYSYKLPSYPSGVSKEIDVKLSFIILPDGTVSNIFPLIKADTRLEMTAINSLRQWRFEPLPAGKKSIAQRAIIVFPYRLQ